MTQIATVERILDSSHAEISVPRKSACGHDCEECAGCGVTGAAVHARALNPIGATPGQKVVVESSTKKMLFFLGYFAALAAAASVAVQYTAAGVGFLLGILGAVGYDRRLRARGGLSFTIVRLF